MKQIIIASLFILFHLGINAQVNPVFHSDDMVFYGLDFSKARFTGGFGLTSPASMQDKYMPALNELMIDERHRYNVAKSYDKKNVEYSFGLSNRHNTAGDIYDQYTNDDIADLSLEEVQNVVKYYQQDEKHSGLGLVYIVDEVNHMRSLISIQITFFDIQSGEIYLVKRARGDMKGFSIRNYYAGGIRQIIKDTEKFYKDWKKEEN